MKKTEDALQQCLAELAVMDLSALRMRFRELTGETPTKSANIDFLRANLTWHCQALHQLLDPVALRQSLLRQSADLSKHKARRCSPGALLVREWQGETYEVIVLEGGFLWQGRHYRSLSPIATAITGTRWSGPRFFGLPTGAAP